MANTYKAKGISIAIKMYRKRIRLLEEVVREILKGEFCDGSCDRCDNDEHLLVPRLYIENAKAVLGKIK